MTIEYSYKGMTVPEGVVHVKQHFTLNELEQVTSFSDLHELRDANMTLPFPNDCGDRVWLKFANAIIGRFDQGLAT